MNKILRLTALLLAAAMCAAFLTACATEGNEPPELALSAGLPPQRSQWGNDEGSFQATLYFLSEDSRKLSTEERTLSCGSSQGMEYAAVAALIKGPESPSLQNSVSSRLNLDRVEVSMGVCNVYLNGSLPREGQDWLIARVAIAATLRDTTGTEGVNVFYSGKEQGYNSMPLGEARPISEALDVYLSNIDRLYLEEASEAGRYSTHYATLYFANAEGTLLAAQSASLSYAVDAEPLALVEMLTSKLAAGDPGGSGLEPVLPADFQLAAEPKIVVIGAENPTPEQNAKNTANPAGATPGPTTAPLPLYAPKIVELTIKEPALSYDETLMCAALTMTLTGYLPSVNGIRVFIQDDTGAVTKLYQQEDYLTRELFRDLLGTSVVLAYPDSEGLVLKRVERIIPSSQTLDPYQRLCELLRGPADPGVQYPVFTEQDVESVYISDGVAVVNWKAGFSQKVEEMIAQKNSSIPAERRELLFLYGVVNTLAQFPYVNRVWMLEDGKKLGTVGQMYLGNALVCSPGLMESE